MADDWAVGENRILSIASDECHNETDEQLCLMYLFVSICTAISA